MIAASASSRSRSRSVAFAALCVVALAGAGAYLYARMRDVPRIPEPTVDITDPALMASVRQRTHLVFRNMAPGADYGVMSLVPLDERDGPRAATTLRCHRVYSSGGTVLCLSVNTNPGQPYTAYVLDDTLAVRQAFVVPGVPSRVRVSHDGALGAYTVFTGRDSYMATGFSTRARLVSAASGKTLADLEEFEAWRDGARFSAVDFNYWGVTFSRDPSRFYATLGTAGHTYLVEGAVDDRRVTVVTDGVECPSLSPDGQRIAFKKKTGGPGIWRPAVLDLRSRSELVLPETNGVDDQIEWLDDAHILYAIRDLTTTPRRANIWMLAADGSRPPELFLADAESPAVVRR